MSNHHAYQMYAHVTWHTWKRVGCVDAAAASDERSAIASACQATGVRVLRGAVLANHVHLVVSFRPDIRLSAGLLRDHDSQTRPSRTTRYVADQFQRHPDL